MIDPPKRGKLRCTTYLKPLFTVKAYPMILAAIEVFIRRSGVKFDAIAMRGASGALVVPTLAMNMQKQMLLVRKGAKSHSTYKTEGPTTGTSYIIVDDMIASGNTIEAILHALPNNKCVGVFTWLDGDCNHYTNDYDIKEKVKIYCMDVRIDRKINSLIYDGDDYD